MSVRLLRSVKGSRVLRCQSSPSPHRRPQQPEPQSFSRRSRTRIGALRASTRPRLCSMHNTTERRGGGDRRRLVSCGPFRGVPDIDLQWSVHSFGATNNRAQAGQAQQPYHNARRMAAVSSSATATCHSNRAGARAGAPVRAPLTALSALAFSWTSSIYGSAALMRAAAQGRRGCASRCRRGCRRCCSRGRRFWRGEAFASAPPFLAALESRPEAAAPPPRRQRQRRPSACPGAARPARSAVAWT